MINDDPADPGRPGGRSRLGRACLLATAAATALLAAACAGGSSVAAPSASPGRAEQMDAFALCVRNHGVAGFYISRTSVTSAADYNGPGLYLGDGWISTPITPGSPMVRSALKACNHVLGIHGQPMTATSAQLRSAVKAAKCMRAHGYPAFPDPIEQNGQAIEPPLPASINAGSPQFEIGRAHV